MMKKKFLLVFYVVLFLFASASPSFAILINLYVDAAPNVYGSPDYDAWKAAAFSAAADGTFINMASGINPANIGTTEFEIQDEVVYSFGDLGKRLTWLYWIPSTTIAGLEADNFQIKLENYWDGTYEDFYLDYYGSTWLTPTKWEEYNGGVIGTAGMAWWGAYGTNTQAALDADIADWGTAEETWVFTAQSDTGINSINSHRAPVPEPCTMLLFGFGLLGLASKKKLKI